MKNKVILALSGAFLSVASVSSYAEQFGVENYEDVETVISVENIVDEIDSKKSLQDQVARLTLLKNKATLEQQIKIIKESDALNERGDPKKSEAPEIDQEQLMQQVSEMIESRISSSEMSNSDKNLTVEDTGSVSSKDISELVFVTDIGGIGGNLKATFYFKNNSAKRGVGELLMPGVKVVDVNKNGALLNHNGDMYFVDLTTAEYAYNKTFNKEQLDHERLLQEAQLGLFEGKPMSE